MVNLWLPWLQEQGLLDLFVVKPWLIFIREHGENIRCIDGGEIIADIKTIVLHIVLFCTFCIAHFTLISLFFFFTIYMLLCCVTFI